jgi:hypothetical protein
VHYYDAFMKTSFSRGFFGDDVSLSLVVLLLLRLFRFDGFLLFYFSSFIIGCVPPYV